MTKTKTHHDDDTAERAEIDQLLTQLAERIGVPYLQLKAVMERTAHVAEAPPPPRRADYEHLRGQALTLTQAAEKYNAPRTTLRVWAAKGYITVLDASHSMKIDEADVAFCMAVKARRDALGIIAKVPFFNAAGEPVYEVKFADQARDRREKKMAASSNRASTVATMRAAHKGTPRSKRSDENSDGTHDKN